LFVTGAAGSLNLSGLKTSRPERLLLPERQHPSIAVLKRGLSSAQMTESRRPKAGGGVNQGMAAAGRPQGRGVEIVSAGRCGFGPIKVGLG
jgi:hypothetical protein